MTTQQSRDAALKQDLGALIDAVELAELHKRFLRLRWLDQMLWAERRAGQARDWYYTLRILAIVGGVIVPALVSLNLQASIVGALVGWITFALSLAVAISLAVESFFRWGERWTHYRRMAEMLKSEGWMFFQLAGPYQEPGTHAGLFSFSQSSLGC